MQPHALANSKAPLITHRAASMAGSVLYGLHSQVGQHELFRHAGQVHQPVQPMAVKTSTLPVKLHKGLDEWILRSSFLIASWHSSAFFSFLTSCLRPACQSVSISRFRICPSGKGSNVRSIVRKHHQFNINNLLTHITWIHSLAIYLPS